MSTCKRMWTEREIRSLAVNSVEKKEDLKVFEHIVDKDGHKRFVEGDIALNEIAGFSKTYGKWSLCGTHLMIVLAVSIVAGSTLADDTFLGTVGLPDWIKSKIVAISGAAVSVQQFTAYKEQQPWVTENIKVALVKDGNSIRLKNLTGTQSFTNNDFVRIQFDLLIDNE